MATAAQPSQNRNKVGDVATDAVANTYAAVNSGLAFVNNASLKNVPTIALGAAAAAFAGPIGLGVAGVLALKVAFEAVMAAGKTYQESYKKVDTIFRPNKDKSRVEMPQQANRAPENTAEQPVPVRKQEEPIAKKEEEKIQIVMPNAQQSEPKTTTKQKVIIEIESAEAATPEQVTQAQAATLESPLNETLGAAQQNAAGKIVRPVLDVPALLAQTKTNAQGIDAKIDAAMGKSPTDKDVMESINKFTAALISNMQQRGVAVTTKGEQETEAYQVRFAQAVQDSMRQSGAYTLQTNVEGAGRTFELKTPIAAGKVGRNVGNSANYALNGVEKDFNNHEALMNKAAGLTAIQAQKDFQTDGKFDAKKVAEAFGRGEFDSFKGDDKRIAALYNAAEMVTEQYNKEQAKAKVQENAPELVVIETREKTTAEMSNIDEVIDDELTTIPSATERLALPPAKEQLALVAAKETTTTAKDDRGGEELANELQTAIAVRQLAATR